MLFVSLIETEYLPIVWALLAFAIHVGGAAALMLQVQLEAQHPPDKPLIGQLLERELQPCIQHPPARLTLCTESYGFIILSWLTSIGTVLYLIYGTMLFSGALFIAIQYAEIVAGRLIISVAICRMVLMYELSGMRVVVDVNGEG